MSRQKQKGTSFETAVVQYLKSNVDANVERRTLGGVYDRGDISGVTTSYGERVVIECKNHSTYTIPAWLREAEAERVNDSATIGVVIAKRKGVGEKSMGDQLVLMTLDNLARLLTGPQDAV